MNRNDQIVGLGSGMNLSLMEADSMIRNMFKAVLHYAYPNVIAFRIPYNQGYVNCIRGLVEKEYGVGRVITAWRADWENGSIHIKLKGPCKWTA